MTLRRYAWLWVTAFTIVCAPLLAQGLAADSVLQARTRAISSVLRCPVCQGESIQDSPSELSAQMRDLVR
ncbi:MAG: cytochrome c-type biogenesis protein CcmH, partial [Gemmatimonadaceae bacterium]